MAFTDPAPGIDSKAAQSSSLSSIGGAAGSSGPTGTASTTSGGTGKQLYIAYLHGGSTVREVLIDDLAGLELPVVVEGLEGASSTSSAGGLSGVSGGVVPPPLSPLGRMSSKKSGSPMGRVQSSAAMAPLASSSAVQPAHAEVTEVWKREWLLRRGAECLGLDLATLVAGVRAAAAEKEALVTS